MISVADPPTRRDKLTSYTFQIVVEPDEGCWHAYAPDLESHGAVTWGETREEALRHIEEVVRLVVESMLEHGEPIPAASNHAGAAGAPFVAVSL